MVTSKNSSTDPPSTDLYGFEEDPSDLHPFMHPPPCRRERSTTARQWKPTTVLGQARPVQPTDPNPAATVLPLGDGDVYAQRRIDVVGVFTRSTGPDATARANPLGLWVLGG